MSTTGMPRLDFFGFEAHNGEELVCQVMVPPATDGGFFCELTAQKPDIVRPLLVSSDVKYFENDMGGGHSQFQLRATGHDHRRSRHGAEDSTARPILRSRLLLVQCQ